MDAEVQAALNVNPFEASQMFQGAGDVEGLDDAVANALRLDPPPAEEVEGLDDLVANALGQDRRRRDH